MKKVAIITLVTIIALQLCACGKSKGTEGLIYEARDGAYAVVDYTGDDVHIVIPDLHNDVPVKYIDEYCFEESDVQSVKIGKNVEIIGKSAFGYCTLLKEVYIPASVSRIGTSTEYMASVGAFAHCTSLEKVSFAKNSQLTSLGNDTFEGCKKLEKLELPSTVEFIGYDAFAYSAIKEIHIPASVNYVGDGAFSGFSEEQKIVVYGSTDRWADWARNCTAQIIKK